MDATDQKMVETVNREEGIGRISSSYKITPNNIHYLHYKTFHYDLFECFNKYAKGTLLDIGCGNKPYEKVLFPIVDKYVGCDIVQSSNHKVDILCDATKIPLSNESFDTIICTQTIEHVGEYQLLINEAYRLLKLHGYFIVSGPMYWPLHEEPFDFFRFTKHGFNHILSKSGFTIYEVRSNGGQWSLCGQVLIHSLFNNTKISKFSRIKKRLLLISGVIRLLNLLFLLLDKKFPNFSNTMNYVIVGRKELSNDSN